MLAENSQLELAVVYGSTAHGRDSPRSDIDIGIALKERMTIAQKIKFQNLIQKVMAREVDIIDLRSVSGVILEEALCRGDMIVKKDKALYAQLMKKIWFDRADFMPYRDRILRARRERFLDDKKGKKRKN